jgi:hypothetical protein
MESPYDKSADADRELRDQFVNGKCMYLAAALHRVCGWEIQAVIEPAAGGYGAYVGHAWCIDPTNGFCVDIDGAYPASANGWPQPGNTLRYNLTEAGLYQLTKIGAGCDFSEALWQTEVQQALAVVHGYLLPSIASS